METVNLAVPLRMVALDPIAHGAGSSGNTSLLRRQRVVLPDGRAADVPFVSGNSLRHTLRAALADHACRTLGIPEHSLPKRVVDLLWSGGALTSTGNQVDLQAVRDLDRVMPAVTLLGYSARSDITPGVLWVDNVHVVCAENAFRLPADLAGHPHAGLWEGQVVGEEFGTRHDAAHQAGRWLGLPEVAAAVDGLFEGDTPTPKSATTQMIYDVQSIRPGTLLWSTLTLTGALPAHAGALAAAVDEAAPEGPDGYRTLPLGGMRARGYGRCRLEVDLSPLGNLTEVRSRYEELLRSGAGTVPGMLAALVDA